MARRLSDPFCSGLGDETDGGTLFFVREGTVSPEAFPPGDPVRDFAADVAARSQSPSPSSNVATVAAIAKGAVYSYERHERNFAGARCAVLGISSGRG